MTEKKNQHFVPQFYLRRFSVQENGKQLRLFNTATGKFVNSASLVGQAAAKFYYGEDGELEDSLAHSEAIFAEVLKSIIKTEDLPKHGSKDHRQLLHFAVMTESRNPVKKTAVQKQADVFWEQTKKHVDFPEEHRGTDIRVEVTDPVGIALAPHLTCVLLISDLHIKLLRNDTDRPFITSDNPVVQYNQLLEQKTTLDCITGYGIKGIQIFIPITPRYMLLLYDSQVYYVGRKKRKVVSIDKRHEIDQLNTLQIVNNIQMVYGNEGMTEEYITGLYVKTKSINRPRQSITSNIKMDEGRSFFYYGSSSCKIALGLSFVAYSTYASRLKFNPNGVFFPRDFALEMADALANDPRFQDLGQFRL